MAMQTNRLDKASPLKLGRRFGSGVKNSDFRPNAPVQASQPDAASGAPNTPAENAGLSHCSNANNAFPAPSKDPRNDSVTEIHFAELQDGTLVELVQDSEDPRRTRLAVWKNSEVYFVDRLEQDGQVLVPLSRKSEVLGYVRLPAGALPYESAQALLRCLESLIDHAVRGC